MRIEKPWGYEEILHKGRYVIKLLYIKEGEELSLQFHKIKEETLFAFRNGFIIYKDGGWIATVEEGYVHVPNTTIHTIMPEPRKDALILEVSTPELDDVVRLKDKHGRVQ